MRILFERTTENMQVLNDCVDVIVANMPFRFPVDKTEIRFGREMRGIDALIGKYQDTRFVEAVKALRLHDFVFTNSQQIGSTAGRYIAKPRLMFQFYISAFLGECRDITRSELLAYRGNLSIKTFRGILLHELRHMFQSFLYQKYYYGRDDFDYRTEPVELDAAWLHHLQDFDVALYPDITDYVNAVMDSFSVYKTLSDKQRRHYRAKTARYYFDRHRAKLDQLTVPIKERLRQQRIEFNKRILARLGKFSNAIDLRDLVGYDAGSKRFFLDHDVVRGVMAIIAGNKVVSLVNAPIVYLLMAMVTLPGEAGEVMRHLRSVQRVTLADALNHLASTFAGGWDSDAIGRTIRQVFA